MDSEELPNLENLLKRITGDFPVDITADDKDLIGAVFDNEFPVGSKSTNLDFWRVLQRTFWRIPEDYGASEFVDSPEFLDYGIYPTAIIIDGNKPYGDENFMLWFGSILAELIENNHRIGARYLLINIDMFQKQCTITDDVVCDPITIDELLSKLNNWQLYESTRLKNLPSGTGITVVKDLLAKSRGTLSYKKTNDGLHIATSFTWN